MRRIAQEESAPIVLLESRAPRIAPERLGAYELIGEIAAGGMGTVYLARREGEAGFQRLFAIKVMHEHLAREQSFVEMLLDEARIAARIHHHNVVSVVDLGEAERGHYVVMDYVEGCSLAQLLRARKQLAARAVVPLIVDTLNGLHAAHSVVDDDGDPMFLVHRDVSPANILVGVDGVARITDFGIAKARARITSTVPGVRKGKLAYSAPEQLDGTVEVDARADLFATGAVLWSALTGRRLFRGESDAETIRNLLRKPIAAPSEVNDASPPCYDHVCLRALERDPANRFESAASMAEALQRAASSAGGLATSTEIATSVKECFSDELAARRRVIRHAVHRSRWPARTAPIPEIPGLFEGPSSHTFAATPPSALDYSGVEVEIDLGGESSRLRPKARWFAAAAIAALAVIAFVVASVVGFGGRAEVKPRAAPEGMAAPAAASANVRDHAVRVEPLVPKVEPLVPEVEAAPRQPATIEAPPPRERRTRRGSRRRSRSAPEPTPPRADPAPAERDVLDEIETNPYTQ